MTAPRRRRTSMAVIAAVALGIAACGSTTETADDTTIGATDAVIDDPVDATGDVQRFPDVIAADATSSNGTWTISVTVSSPYDSPERYADGWRILGPDGTEYGFRLLTHDHAGEQPFTRSLSGVAIPDGIDTVTIEGRDQQYGFGGDTFELVLPDS